MKYIFTLYFTDGTIEDFEVETLAQIKDIVVANMDRIGQATIKRKEEQEEEVKVR